MSDEAKRIPPNALIAAGAVVAFAAVGAGGYLLGVNQNHTTGGGAQTEDGRRVLYWYDPMVPQHFDAPGRSPFMAMELVPRYADEAPAAAGVRIDPGVAQNLGVRLATVERANERKPAEEASS